jgi:hypothetical protein
MNSEAASSKMSDIRNGAMKSAISAIAVNSSLENGSEARSAVDPLSGVMLWKQFGHPRGTIISKVSFLVWRQKSLQCLARDWMI